MEELTLASKIASVIMSFIIAGVGIAIFIMFLKDKDPVSDKN